MLTALCLGTLFLAAAAVRARRLAREEREQRDARDYRWPAIEELRRPGVRLAFYSLDGQLLRETRRPILRSIAGGKR